MPASPLPPPRLVADENSLAGLVTALASCPIVAVDTESNSLHAYRERVCLIQFTTPDADVIVDPIALTSLGVLAPFFANRDQQKVFHAAEYDLLCLKRDYHFDIRNIFDTMSAAARWAGRRWTRRFSRPIRRHDQQEISAPTGSAGRSRPGTARLRAPRHTIRSRCATAQLEALTLAGRSAEAHENSNGWRQVRPPENQPPDPAAFWRSQRRQGPRAGAGGDSHAVFAFREQQAERLGSPAIQGHGRCGAARSRAAGAAAADELQAVSGMTPIRCAAMDLACCWPSSKASTAASTRAHRRSRAGRRAIAMTGLHNGGRKSARVAWNPDVILPRTALWDLARRVPRNDGELARHHRRRTGAVKPRRDSRVAQRRRAPPTTAHRNEERTALESPRIWPVTRRP